MRVKEYGFFKRGMLCGLFSAFAAASSCRSGNEATPSPEKAAPSKSVILDVDTGRDDAWTIVGAMRQLQLKAVVASYGNISLDRTTQNSLDVLKLSETSIQDNKYPLHAIPVWRGENVPLEPASSAGLAEIGKRRRANGNGLCNVFLTPNAEHAIAPPGDWAMQFQKFLIQNDRKVDYIVCGPMTNLARLTDRFAEASGNKNEIKRYINRVIAMGGSFDPSLPVDFNFKADPLAAQKVIDTFGADLTLVPYDETKKLLLTEQEILGYKARDPAAVFSRDLMLAQCRGWSPNHTLMLHDPTTLLAEDESVATRFEKISIMITGEQAGKVIENQKGVTVRRVVIPPDEVNSCRNKLLFQYLDLAPAPN